MSPTLSRAVFWIAVLTCVVAQLGILRATRIAPQSRAGRSSPPAHRPATRAEELAWAVLPAVALALVLVLTWRAVHARTSTPTAAPVAAAAGSAA